MAHGTKALENLEKLEKLEKLEYLDYLCTGVSCMKHQFFCLLLSFCSRICAVRQNCAGNHLCDIVLAEFKLLIKKDCATTIVSSVVAEGRCCEKWVFMVCGGS